MSLSIFIPVNDNELGNRQYNGVLNTLVVLIIVKKLVSVNLRLTEHILEKLKVAFIFDVNIARLVTLAALLQAVVLFLQLADDSSVTTSALNTDEKEIIM